MSCDAFSASWRRGSTLSCSSVTFECLRLRQVLHWVRLGLSLGKQPPQTLQTPCGPPPKHTRHTPGERATHSACIAREETVGAHALTSPGCLGCDMAAPAPPLLRLLHLKQQQSAPLRQRTCVGGGLLPFHAAFPVAVLLTWCAQQRRSDRRQAVGSPARAAFGVGSTRGSTSHEKNVRPLSISSTLYRTHNHVLSYFIAVLEGQAHIYRYLKRKGLPKSSPVRWKARQVPSAYSKRCWLLMRVRPAM
jgi:hypothetical protein